MGTVSCLELIRNKDAEMFFVFCLLYHCLHIILMVHLKSDTDITYVDIFENDIDIKKVTCDSFWNETN